jgi:hypothetical protein
VRVTFAGIPSRPRLDQDVGVTRKLTLRVTSIYPRARYSDLALSEITFWAVPS